MTGRSNPIQSNLELEQVTRIVLRVAKTDDADGDRQSLIDALRMRQTAMMQQYDQVFAGLDRRIPTVTGPNGCSMLISGGDQVNAQIVDPNELQALWSASWRQLDSAFMTHDEDHASVFEKLEEERVDRENIPAKPVAQPVYFGQRYLWWLAGS